MRYIYAKYENGVLVNMQNLNDNNPEQSAVAQRDAELEAAGYRIIGVSQNVTIGNPPPGLDANAQAAWYVAQCQAIEKSAGAELTRLCLSAGQAVQDPKSTPIWAGAPITNPRPGQPTTVQRNFLNVRVMYRVDNSALRSKLLGKVQKGFARVTPVLVEAKES